MQINATFLIQIINFWISYAMLHKLLFKPFVQLIEKKHAAQAKMLGLIKSKEHVLVVLQDDKKQNLEDFRAHLKATYQTLPPKLQPVPATDFFDVEQKTITDITTTVKEIIVQKAPYAY